MVTAAVVGGLFALAGYIGYRSGKNNTGDPAGEISNNPYSEWEDRQPYTP